MGHNSSNEDTENEGVVNNTTLINQDDNDKDSIVSVIVRIERTTVPYDGNRQMLESNPVLKNPDTQKVLY